MMMKCFIVMFVFPSCISGVTRRSIPFAYDALATSPALNEEAKAPLTPPALAPSNAVASPKGWSELFTAAKDLGKGFLNIELHWTPSAARAEDAQAAIPTALVPSDAQPSKLRGVALRDLTFGYESALSGLAAVFHRNTAMLHTQQSTANRPPTTSEMAAGTLVLDGGHRMTTHKGWVHSVMEEAGFGTLESLLSLKAIFSLGLYAFIGATTSSFVARTFKLPSTWFAMLVNIFIWPVCTVVALPMLVFFRVLGKREARNYLFGAKSKSSKKRALTNEDAWCAYHVAHAAQGQCTATINSMLHGREFVTPQSLREACHISQKGALGWHRWLSGGSSALTVTAMLEKTEELPRADASKICCALFEIYDEPRSETLSVTDALNVLQGWGAGKYGPGCIWNPDMEFLINTMLTHVRLGESDHVHKSDWMKLANVYPEFFDVESKLPRHARYLRLMTTYGKLNPPLHGLHGVVG